MRKGTDLITLNTLIELGACKEGLEFFAEHHPDGGEYQKVLDTACEHGHPDFASWLLDKLGPTDAVLAVDEIKTDGSVVFAGKIVVERSIEAGGCINAGGSIKAGWWIKTGGCIKAGYDSGIYAGLKAKLSDKSNRTVTAKIKPDNLMCGEFAPLEDSHEN